MLRFFLFFYHHKNASLVHREGSSFASCGPKMTISLFPYQPQAKPEDGLLNL